mmetsp:Transcript_97855/g.168453  ORF Transcript_97855/g.168453 Transcript_97855/m.168453 type:complete len:88 (-) Transcript_97855:199-462(-)
MTVRLPVLFKCLEASCNANEPVAELPGSTKSTPLFAEVNLDGLRPLPKRCKSMFIRSNMASQAINATDGTAAASSYVRALGFNETAR